MKKLIAGLGIVAVFFSFAGYADASSIKKVLDDSLATVTSSFDIFVKMANHNDIDLVNSASSGSNSGGNAIVSGDSLTTTSVTTGDTGAATMVDNTGNSNALTEDVQTDEDDGASGPAIEDVEDSSTAVIAQSDTVDNEMGNWNAGPVDNTASSDADAGNNAVASADDQSGTTIVAGKALSGTVIVNLLHTNIKDILREVGM